MFFFSMLKNMDFFFFEKKLFPLSRVISRKNKNIMNAFWGDRQYSTLADYIRTSMMLHQNKRKL